MAEQAEEADEIDVARAGDDAEGRADRKTTRTAQAARDRARARLRAAGEKSDRAEGVRAMAA